MRLSRKNTFLLILFIGLTQSCTGYRPMPLDSEVKAVLAGLGMIEEVYRLPLVPLGQKHRPLLRWILTGLRKHR